MKQLFLKCNRVWPDKKKHVGMTNQKMPQSQNTDKKASEYDQ